MNLPALSIRRPVLVTGIVLFIIMIGGISFARLGVDLFPDVNFPIISVSVPYIGVSPEEMETLVSKVVEEEVSAISGLEQLTSINQDGLAIIMAKFAMETDIKDAEQQIREKLSKIRQALPKGIEEPLIQRLSPSDVPIVRLSIEAEMKPADLYDLAKEKIKPKLERLKNIGAIKIIGGTRREIQVELDRRQLNSFEISAYAIAGQLSKYGSNVPVGKYETKEKETTFKTKGRFETLKQIEDAVVSFSGDAGGGLALRQLAKIRDGVEDAKTKAFLFQRSAESPKGTSRPAVYLDIYKQSGSNTVAVADSVLESLTNINGTLKDVPGKPRVSLVRDSSQWIRMNIEEATHHIFLAILLTVIVVYFFLGNLRSTLITGIALPNSILGAFILMYAMGFTINIITLLALTLAVGLLVDDAIVVRENIFRNIEAGMHPVKASEIGTNQVVMAVVATTITMISVFLPVGFMSGMVGQFFKQFGLTMIFAMLISLFDGLVVAPMLSAYFTGKVSHKVNFMIRGFQRFQDRLEALYVRIMNFGLKRPLIVLGVALLIFAGSIGSLRWVKST
ncbi:MAG TPA: efflux RND transporter permease subunit, partial [bacterium]|nr:efflux RND transporter permease subunit [bacterium]